MESKITQEKGRLEEWNAAIFLASECSMKHITYAFSKKLSKNSRCHWALSLPKCAASQCDLLYNWFYISQGSMEDWVSNAERQQWYSRCLVSFPIWPKHHSKFSDQGWIQSLSDSYGRLHISQGSMEDLPWFLKADLHGLNRISESDHELSIDRYYRYLDSISRRASQHWRKQSLHFLAIRLSTLIALHKV